MRIEGFLGLVNSFHGAFESAPVHALRLFDVVAYSFLSPNLPAQSERSRKGAIMWRFALTLIAEPIGFPTKRRCALLRAGIVWLRSCRYAGI
jgi:hypothetical protein